jgi:hypothetical protein
MQVATALARLPAVGPMTDHVGLGVSDLDGSKPWGRLPPASLAEPPHQDPHQERRQVSAARVAWPARFGWK